MEAAKLRGPHLISSPTVATAYAAHWHNRPAISFRFCFDRIVIYGYLSGLSRPEQVVHFFRQVVGVPVVSKEVLS